MYFTLEMNDGACYHSIQIEANSVKEALDDMDEKIQDWVEDGEWGNEGACVGVHWKLINIYTDRVVDEGYATVEIEPDHDALMKEVADNPYCNHDFTREGEHGLKENPGVWSTGGTSMKFCSHCIYCGLHKTEYSCGSQRNPGEHDSVEYRQLDKEEIAWHIANGSMESPES